MLHQVVSVKKYILVKEARHVSKKDKLLQQMFKKILQGFLSPRGKCFLGDDSMHRDVHPSPLYLLQVELSLSLWLPARIKKINNLSIGN